jgi:hypothetical protein
VATPAKFIADITSAQRHLHAFVSSVVWNIADADEVVQETNLALWQKAADYDPDRPFLPWAMAFAQMQLKAWLKRRQRVPIVFDDALIERMAAESVAAAAELDALCSVLRSGAAVVKIPAMCCGSLAAPGTGPSWSAGPRARSRSTAGSTNGPPRRASSRGWPTTRRLPSGWTAG